MMSYGEINMGWDLTLVDPVTKEELYEDTPHQIKGGTYALGGTDKLWMSITYNYSKFYYEHFPDGEGLNWLNEKLAADTIPIIQGVIDKLGDDATDRYWDKTSGNAKKALYGVLALAKLRPDGMFQVN
jgi:hypothetical protein